MTHPARLSIEALLKECTVKRTRASGPGGQHRNKVETAIVITHQPTGVIGQASEKRSQAANRAVAIERLRLNLALAERRPGPALVPSELWESRRAGQRIRVSLQHEDFAALLSEALDFIQARQWDVRAAAEALGVSTSQLVKFLQTCPAAIEHVNRERQQQGLKRLN